MTRLARHEDFDEGPQSLRLWLSDQQWMALLSRIEREARDYHGPERRNRQTPRYPTRLRCVVRAQHPQGGSGTYVIRVHNISAGGLGFIHTQPLPRGGRCTVALQTEDGNGLIASGRVAWVRQLDLPSAGPADAFEVGVQFDQPINPAPFTGDNLPPSA